MMWNWWKRSEQTITIDVVTSFISVVERLVLFQILNALEDLSKFEF